MLSSAAPTESWLFPHRLFWMEAQLLKSQEFSLANNREKIYQIMVLGYRKDTLMRYQAKEVAQSLYSCMYWLSQFDLRTLKTFIYFPHLFFFFWEREEGDSRSFRFHRHTLLVLQTIFLVIFKVVPFIFCSSYSQHSMRCQS